MAGLFTAGQQPQGMFGLGNSQRQDFQKGLFGLGQKVTNQAMNQGPLSYSGLGALPGQGDFAGEKQRVEGMMRNDMNRRLDERFAKERSSFDQQRANQGVDIGTERYRDELKAFEDQRNRAYQDADMQAMQAGGAEQSRLFNQALAARQQGVGEANTQYNQPLASLQALSNPALGFSGLESQEAMQGAGFGFQGQQNELGRGHEMALQQGSQGFQAGQNEAARGLQEKMQLRDINLTTEESARDRELNRQMQQGQFRQEQDMFTRQSQMQKQLQDAGFTQEQAMQAAQILGQKELQQGQNQFLGEESQKNRDLSADQFTKTLQETQEGRKFDQYMQSLDSETKRKVTNQLLKENPDPQEVADINNFLANSNSQEAADYFAAIQQGKSSADARIYARRNR